jgi:hypothetical protein
MNLDSANADSEIESDDLVRTPCREGVENLAFARAQESNKSRGLGGITPLTRRAFLVLLLQRGFDGLDEVLIRAGFFEDVKGASFHCPHCGRNVAAPCHNYEWMADATSYQPLLQFKTLHFRSTNFQ